MCMCRQSLFTKSHFGVSLHLIFQNMDKMPCNDRGDIILHDSILCYGFFLKNWMANIISKSIETFWTYFSEIIPFFPFPILSNKMHITRTEIPNSFSATGIVCSTFCCCSCACACAWCMCMCISFEWINECIKKGNIFHSRRIKKALHEH